MKKIDLGQTITVLANMGVIAGIVFLAIELQQNNRLLAAQAEYIVLQNRSDLDVINDPDLAAFWFKVNSGTPLTEVEQYRVELWASQAILNWEWEHGQYVAGNLPRSDLPVAAWRAAFFGEGNQRQIDFAPVWDRMRFQLDPEFVEFVQEQVIVRGPP